MKPFKYLPLVLVCCNLAYAGGGGSGEIVYDPTNWVQNSITAAKTTEQVVNQIQQLQVQAQQYQVELKNIEAFGSGKYVWEDVSSILSNLSSTIQTGNAIAYSMADVDQQFKKTYPGYKPTQNCQQSYQNYSSSTMDTIRGVLDSTSLSFRDFATEESTLNSLKSLSDKPKGQMQAIQAGSMIAGQTASELMSLQQLVMAQTNSQASYQAYKVQNDQNNQAAEDRAFTNLNTDWPKYNANNEGFGPIPNFSQ